MCFLQEGFLVFPRLVVQLLDELALVFSQPQPKLGQVCGSIIGSRLEDPTAARVPPEVPAFSTMCRGGAAPVGWLPVRRKKDRPLPWLLGRPTCQVPCPWQALPSMASLLLQEPWLQCQRALYPCHPSPCQARQGKVGATH